MNSKFTSLEESLEEFTDWANQLAESEWISSANPPTPPRTPDQEIDDRALAVRRKKQDLLKRFALGGKIPEIEWALEHSVFMTKEQMLDYLDHTVEDPGLEPIEYMHDKGFTSDSMLKGLFKRLLGLGLSNADIMGIIKRGNQGKPASPELIKRVAGQALQSDDIAEPVSEDATDEKTWYAQIKAKYPTVRFIQAKMIGAPIVAYVNGKEVDRFLTGNKPVTEAGEKDYAYHRAKERHHEKEGDKAMARADSFGAYAHPQGIAARKAAERHYAKADEHRSAWKELGSAPVAPVVAESIMNENKRLKMLAGIIK